MPEIEKGTTSFAAIVGIAGFAGLLLGLLTPTMFFSSRLAVMEERSSTQAAALNDIRDDIRKLTNAILLRETQNQGRK
jgi:hypothetical protein